MKLLKTINVIILITAIIFAGCKNKTSKELLVKKWKVIEISGGMATQMPDSVKKKVTGNTLMEFTNDGKYILTGMDKLFHNGNYILSDDEKTLTITPEATKESEKNTIEQISESKLIFTDKLGTRLVAVPQ